jgi:aromatic-L-amino-acid decarboxylase
MHGIGPFRTNLEEKLALARHAARELSAMPDIEILAEPQLSILAFRLAPAGLDGAGLDRLNRELLDRINAKRRIFLSGTTLRDRFAIRICVLSFRTHRDRMDQGLEDIREAAAEAKIR